MSNDMKLVGSERVDLTTWGFDVGNIFKIDLPDDVSDGLDKVIGHIVSHIIAEEFKKSPPDAWLPIEWWATSDGLKGEAVSDPLTIYFGAPLGPSEDFVHWQTSLSAMIDDVVDLHIGSGGPPFFDDRGETILKKIARALREEADRIDKIIVDGRVPS